MSCGICNKVIDDGLRYISCPTCLADYHVDHLVEWTTSEWKCQSCGNGLRDEIGKVVVIIELHSSFITVGFAGEAEPRESFPFQIGKPKYTHFCGLDLDPEAYYKFSYGGYFADELKNLRGVLKAIEVSEKGMLINPRFFLQVLNYCFYQILKIDPMNHPLIVANSVLTNQEQRSLIEQLLFDVFGFPRLFMSSHQFFTTIVTGQSSCLTIELDHDMIIIVPVVDEKIHYPGLRMELLSAVEMTEHQVELRSEIKDMSIRKKVLHFVEDSLAKMNRDLLAKIGNTVLCFDLGKRVNDVGKLVDPLQKLLGEYGHTDSEIGFIDDRNKFVSWSGVNRFILKGLMGYSWTENSRYRHVGLQYLRDQDLSPEHEQRLRSRSGEILKENGITSKKKFVNLTVPSSDIEAVSVLKNLSTLTVSPARNNQLGQLLRFEKRIPYRISLELAEDETSSHIYAKLEYLTLIKLQCLPYFGETGLELISVK